MRIALFEPEIAGNVGAILRLGACLGALPGGFNGIPDIVARREASAALHAAGVEAAGGPDPSVTREDFTGVRDKNRVGEAKVLIATEK